MLINALLESDKFYNGLGVEDVQNILILHVQPPNHQHANGFLLMVLQLIHVLINPELIYHGKGLVNIFIPSLNVHLMLIANGQLMLLISSQLIAK